MGSETAWGLGSLILIVAFVSYAFYLGSKVRRPPNSGSSNTTVDLTSVDDLR